MPYPVYKKLTHLNASFQQWLLQIPPDKNTGRTYQGSAATVIAPTFRRKICSAFLKLVTSAGLIGIALCNTTGINLSTHREISVIMIILISILVRMLYFDAWSASKEGLVVGRLFFKLSIPWSKITAFKIGIPEIDKPGSRRTGFSIHLQSGDKTLEFHDGKFKSIFPVYRAIKTFRPDLKNQCPSR